MPGKSSLWRKTYTRRRHWLFALTSSIGRIQFNSCSEGTVQRSGRIDHCQEAPDRMSGWSCFAKRPASAGFLRFEVFALATAACHDHLPRKTRWAATRPCPPPPSTVRCLREPVTGPCHVHAHWQGNPALPWLAPTQTSPRSRPRPRLPRHTRPTRQAPAREDRR